MAQTSSINIEPILATLKTLADQYESIKNVNFPEGNVSLQTLAARENLLDKFKNISEVVSVIHQDLENKIKKGQAAIKKGIESLANGNGNGKAKLEKFNWSEEVTPETKGWATVVEDKPKEKPAAAKLPASIPTSTQPATYAFIAEGVKIQAISVKNQNDALKHPGMFCFDKEHDEFSIAINGFVLRFGYVCRYITDGKREMFFEHKHAATLNKEGLDKSTYFVPRELNALAGKKHRCQLLTNLVCQPAHKEDKGTAIAVGSHDTLSKDIYNFQDWEIRHHGILTLHFLLTQIAILSNC